MNDGPQPGPLRHVKPEVRALRAYTLAAREAAVKLNQNENPWDVPAPLKQLVLERVAARAWSRYPAFEPRALRTALAAFAGWRADGILAGNGSNELIQALLLVSVGPGTPVVIPEPTFTLYAQLATILGGELVRVGLDAALQYDVQALRAARAARSAPVTIVCSPNNPTGSVLPAEAVARLCAEADGLVVVDEAYHEFSGTSVLPLLAEHSNLVVLRTFSKAMALAGLRVGYLLAAPELVREVDKARLPYNLNLVSETAALALLEQPELLAERVRELVRLREALAERLAALPGVRVHPSQANFLLFELEHADARAVFEALHRRGVLVRDVTGYPRLERCLRVSVGSADENETFLHALGTALVEAVAGSARC
jgi:histidinol-phosphate aminotransferase